MVKNCRRFSYRRFHSRGPNALSTSNGSQRTHKHFTGVSYDRKNKLQRPTIASCSVARIMPRRIFFRMQCFILIPSYLTAVKSLWNWTPFKVHCCKTFYGRNFRNKLECSSQARLSCLAKCLFVWLEGPARQKHSSWFWTFVNYSRKKFYNMEPRLDSKTSDSLQPGKYL